MTFSGFPARVRSVPVPSPVFGTLLEQIDNLAELKCTLRVIWLLQEKRGFPRFVTHKELLADRTLARALAEDGSPNPALTERALSLAVSRGTLATAAVEREGEQEHLYALNTEQDRNALARITNGALSMGHTPKPQPWEGALDPPNIFALYEDNIGILSPMIAEELREAEQHYPDAWIKDAIRESAEHNRRSWRYISRILERWEREGRSNGESGRYPKKTGYY